MTPLETLKKLRPTKCILILFTMLRTPVYLVRLQYKFLRNIHQSARNEKTRGMRPLFFFLFLLSVLSVALCSELDCGKLVSYFKVGACEALPGAQSDTCYVTVLAQISDVSHSSQCGFTYKFYRHQCECANTTFRRYFLTGICKYCYVRKLFTYRIYVSN